MLAFSFLAVAAAIPLALGARTTIANKNLAERLLAQRDSALNCFQFQYAGPFTAFGFGGWVNLYANVTVWHPENQTYTFDQTRVAVIDGKVQPCGKCQLSQTFGFELCEGPGAQGYDGGPNSAKKFYGHLVARDSNGIKSCLAAKRSAGNLDGIDLVPSPCQYNYDVVKTNGQYWVIDANDGVFKAQLVQDIQGESHVYGPSPDGKTLYDMSGSGRPWTYYGFYSEWA